MSNSLQSVELPFVTQITRPLIERIWRSKYPVEITEGKEHLQEANELLNLGYGMVYMMNHFSLGDTQRGFQILLQLETAQARFFGGPMAYVHRTKANAFLSKRVAGIATYEVVPPRYMKQFLKNHSKDEVKSLGLAYLAQTTRLLCQGGILGLAPQSTRQPKLGTPKYPVVQSIVDALKSNESNGLSKSLPAVFFWCVGLGIQGVTDCGVEGIDGKNKEVMYQAHAGKPKTLSSLLGEMGEKDQSADQMIYSELTTLVPQAYLGEC